MLCYGIPSHLSTLVHVTPFQLVMLVALTAFTFSTPAGPDNTVHVPLLVNVQMSLPPDCVSVPLQVAVMLPVVKEMTTMPEPPVPPLSAPPELRPPPPPPPPRFTVPFVPAAK